MESDEEIRRVPEFGFEQAGPSTSGQEAGSATGADRAQSTAQAGQRRRGRSPADKEHKRLKSAMPVPDDVVRGIHLVLVIIQLRYRLRQVDCDRDCTKSTEGVVRGSDT
ncbi:hypothetical protein GW17_00012362 [Ensete ventricosum]|nr:hypothetical protein GW17_00012362 [Ensete ventricosum]